jgi:hypothetical protein
VTDPTPTAPQCIDVEAWRIPSKEEMRAYIDSLKARPDRTKQTKSRQPRSILAVRQNLSPLDLYCYLNARFGNPNGFQTFRPARPLRVKVGNPADATRHRRRPDRPHERSATRAGDPALGYDGVGDRPRGVSSSRINSARWWRRRVSAGSAVARSTSICARIRGSTIASGSIGWSKYGEVNACFCLTSAC